MAVGMAVPCPAGQWTKIVDGGEISEEYDAIGMKMRETGSVFLYVGATTPESAPPTWPHYYTLSASRPFPKFEGFSEGDRIWVYPDGSSAKTVEITLSTGGGVPRGTFYDETDGLWFYDETDGLYFYDEVA